MTSYEEKAIKCMIGEYFLQCDGKKTAQTHTQKNQKPPQQNKTSVESLSDYGRDLYNYIHFPGTSFILRSAKRVT